MRRFPFGTMIEPARARGYNAFLTALLTPACLSSRLCKTNPTFGGILV